jgi:hypothetical protein
VVAYATTQKVVSVSSPSRVLALWLVLTTEYGRRDIMWDWT